MEKLTFNNGQTMPSVGLGTWQANPGVVEKAIRTAIDLGYRHIDCAFVYGNEKEIGEALKAKMDDGTVKREDLFITSKLWNTCHGAEQVPKAMQHTLDCLGLEYVDLYLIHWPFAFKPGDQNFPADVNDDILNCDTHFTETWKAMEDLVDAGKAKSIGISNFNSKQIQEVLDMARIPPASHQIEVNPYLNQEKLVNFCKEKGITVTGYSPLGCPSRPSRKPEDPVLLKEPKVLSIAERLGRTPAQVVLRWAVQRGISVVPKSTNEGRLKANIEIFDFSLTDEDMAALNSYEDYRWCRLEGAVNHPLYPFHIEF